MEWTNDEVDFLRNNFDKMLYREIAIILKRTEKSIKRKCQYLGIKTRKIGEVNHDYFDSWSSNMAYILGFTVADGCVQYNIEKSRYCLEFCIHKKDIEVLEFIKNELKSNIEIFYAKNNDMIYLKLTSKKICEKLISFGITPQKTGKEILPIGLPDEFLWDFIRGYFDGDGCISFREKNPRCGSFFICCSSKEILTDIQSKTTIGKVISKIDKRRLSTMYNWEVLDHESMRDLYFKLYNGNFSLSRKHNKFTQYINNINAPTYKQIKEAAKQLIAA